MALADWLKCPACAHDLPETFVRSANAALQSAKRGAKRGGRKPVLSPADEARIKTWTAAGRRQVDIARALGVSQPTISAAVRRLKNAEKEAAK